MQSKITKIKAKKQKKEKNEWAKYRTKQNKKIKLSARLAALITHLSFEFEIFVGMLRSRKSLQISISFFLL